MPADMGWKGSSPSEPTAITPKGGQRTGSRSSVSSVKSSSSEAGPNPRAHETAWAHYWSVITGSPPNSSTAGGWAPASARSRYTNCAGALQSLESKRSPFSKRLSGVAARGVIHWAKPELVVEVSFAAWTEDGILRHASFEGIREDKEPHEITLELPVAEPDSRSDDPSEVASSRRQHPAASPGDREGARRQPTDGFAGIRLSHPDRILFPDEKITKRDLAEYYSTIAAFILPHIVGQPLSLMRCPNGIKKSCFYQKHLGLSMPQSVAGIEINEGTGIATYLVIDDLTGLISLVQLGVVEIHPWGSREDRLEQPDRLIIDIDPGEGVAWNNVVRAARHVRQRLEDLGLETFLRTTGGKGLHVVVPIARRVSWENLKTFAKAFADSLVREQPDRYIAQPSKAKRAGKIYIDYLRNDRGATAVAPYSTGRDPERLSRPRLHGMSFRIHCGLGSSIRKRCPSGSGR